MSHPLSAQSKQCIQSKTNPAQHPNLVRYFTSWIEAETTGRKMLVLQLGECGTTRLSLLSHVSLLVCLDLLHQISAVSSIATFSLFPHERSKKQQQTTFISPSPSMCSVQQCLQHMHNHKMVHLGVSPWSVFVSPIAGGEQDCHIYRLGELSHTTRVGDVVVGCNSSRLLPFRSP